MHAIYNCSERARRGAPRLARAGGRAAQHGRSAGAEIRDILGQAVKPEGRVKLGSLLADIGREAKLTGEEFAVIERVRDKTPSQPVLFERFC